MKVLKICLFALIVNYCATNAQQRLLEEDGDAKPVVTAKANATATTDSPPAEKAEAPAPKDETTETEKPEKEEKAPVEA